MALCQEREDQNMLLSCFLAHFAGGGGKWEVGDVFFLFCGVFEEEVGLELSRWGATYIHCCLLLVGVK